MHGAAGKGLCLCLGRQNRGYQARRQYGRTERKGHRHPGFLANLRADPPCTSIIPYSVLGVQQEGYGSIPPLAVAFNLCDRRFAPRSGRMTWHLMKK